ncbi:MAG: hypothetical protein UY13_C0002G0098 [Candidatus Pacebacteria bacterium GW2011_GWB1_47_8]|nr:MAG: hypothetical protein UX28_C0001G0246 [Candidatus Pacebacteria bacterium GW2011_GWA1_46_10]KKU84186.1 MAG: hypothetical protein UY13_C0002G0098 [Candidatus Pacebacteria bacterium GW2011_GWB1_47_8]HCR81073.1 hypothetical protein [Candidatus Paceibacterota bacterium]
MTDESSIGEERIAAYIDEISAQARLALKGILEPSKLQHLVDQAISDGVPRDRISAKLQEMDVPIIKKQDFFEQQSSFDPEKPINAKEYNALTKRFNTLRRRLIDLGDSNIKSSFDKVNVPIGKILNGAWPGGDTKEARLAYDEISKFLDKIESQLPPVSSETTKA